jgi:hypothetical protein
LPEAQVAPVVVVPPVAQPAPVAQPTPAPVVQPPPGLGQLLEELSDLAAGRPAQVDLGEDAALEQDRVIEGPVFADADGGLIPAAVLDIMDDDDRDPIMGAVADFFLQPLAAELVPGQRVEFGAGAADHVEDVGAVSPPGADFIFPCA